MKVNFSLQDSWQKLNQQTSELLGGVNTHVYRGVHHALVEVLQGLAREFPHKKKVFYFRGQSVFFEAPLKELAMSGLTLVPLDFKLITETDQWLEKVDQQTLLFLYAQDDGFLGQIYSTKKMEEVLSDKRVFKVKLSHALHFYRDCTQSLDKYEVEILSVHKGLAVTKLGERARFSPFVASGMEWSGDFLNEIKEMLQTKIEYKEKILEFEKTPISDFHCFFNSEPQRLYDRAVIYWSDMDGSAFIEELSQWLSKKDSLETTSLIRWGGVKTMDWLEAQGIAKEMIRGLVVIDAKIIDKELPSKLALARKNILKLQNG